MTIDEIVLTLPPVKETLTMDTALATIAARYGVTPASLLERTRRREIVTPRQEVFWLARKCGLSMHRIADYFGMDHTTIIHGIRAVQSRVDAFGGNHA